MKKKLFISILLFWTAIILPKNIMAQQVKLLSREALDSLVYPPLMTDADKILQFSTLTHNIGTVVETHPEIRLCYPFCNVSDDTIRITHVRTLCGCTQSDESSRTLPSGAKDSIIIRFLPLGKIGQIHQKAYVYTTISKHPVACLEIIGKVIEK